MVGRGGGGRGFGAQVWVHSHSMASPLSSPPPPSLPPLPLVAEALLPNIPGGGPTGASEELPRSAVKKIVGRKLAELAAPGGAKAPTMGADAVAAMGESATMFVTMLAAAASDVCQESGKGKRQTINAGDVFKALEDLEMPDLNEPLKQSLEGTHGKRGGTEGGAQHGPPLTAPRPQTRARQRSAGRRRRRRRSKSGSRPRQDRHRPNRQHRPCRCQPSRTPPCPWRREGAPCVLLMMLYKRSVAVRSPVRAPLSTRRCSRARPPSRRPRAPWRPSPQASGPARGS